MRGNALILLGVLIIFLAMLIGYQIKDMQDRNPLLGNMILERDYTHLRQIYFTSEPGISQRKFIGSSTAPLTLIAVLDPTSEGSKLFMREYYPQLKAKYIDTGILRFYPKVFLTLKDVQSKTAGFKYAQTLVCIQERSDYETLLPSFFEGTLPDITCPMETIYDEVYQDAIEIENMAMTQRVTIGIDGKSSTIMGGIPSWILIDRELRIKGLSIGADL